MSTHVLPESGPSSVNWVAVATLLDAVGDAVLGVDNDLQIVWVNAAGKRLAEELGLDPAGLVGQALMELTPRRARPRFERAIELARTSGAPHEEAIRHPRSQRPLHLRFLSLPFGMALVVREDNDALADERLLLRSAVARINDLLVITRAEADENGAYEIEFVNEAFEAQTGWRRDEVIGRPSTLLHGPDTDRDATARMFEHMRRRETVRAEIQHYRRDGSPYWVELVLAPIVDAAGVHTHWVSVHRVITERRALEEQLFQAQKMEAVGRLAGGIAHDFNNVLTAISGFSELLLDELPKGTQSHEEVQQIKLASLRATGLTRQLLAFSRKQIMRPRLVHLGTLVQELERLLVRVTSEAVTLRVKVAPYLSPVLADPVQLEQVLVNLTANAAEAMPEGGRLTIEVSDIALGESYTHRHHGVQPGHYVCLVVTDSGTGMDRETRERIFEPFFSTKSSGSGLGLATVYGIVRQSGGHIWVYSEVGTGTSFKIYLPAATGELPAATQEPTPVEVAGGGETILVVEDEAMVRDVTRAMLLRRGYTVLVASDGDEALSVALMHFGPIHLLLTDVVMPRANGRRVAEQLRITRPETQVLYMSGYTEDAIVHHGVLHQGIRLLEKPFTELALATAVRDALDVESEAELHAQR